MHHTSLSMGSYAPVQQVRRHPVIGQSMHPSTQGSKVTAETLEPGKSAAAATGGSPGQGQHPVSSTSCGKTVRNTSSQQQQLSRSAFSIESILEPKSPRKQKHQLQHQQQRHLNQENHHHQHRQLQHQQLLRFSGQQQQPALPLPASVYGAYPRPSYIIPAAIIPSSYYPLGKTLQPLFCIIYYLHVCSCTRTLESMFVCMHVMCGWMDGWKEG